jgi:hypothetical protein
MSRVRVKTKVMTIKMTPEQYRTIEQRAARSQVNMSAWGRSVMSQAASRPASGGYIRIKEPNGDTT